MEKSCVQLGIDCGEKTRLEIRDLGAINTPGQTARVFDYCARSMCKYCAKHFI